MVIFELPASGDGDGLRAASLGSCRIRNPLYALRDQGDLTICAGGLAATHTAAEARQTLALVRGELSISDFLSLYVFETDQTPSTAGLGLTLDGGVDAFLLEVSDDKQFYYRDICLQQNFVARSLVQPCRGALLAWYREVCLRRPVDEGCVQTALGNLREGGFRCDEEMADLLRHMRLERHGGDHHAATLKSMMAEVGGRWIVVGSIVIPGHEGAIMHDRRALNDNLKAAADLCGATFYDPSQLVSGHGRATALESDGANIYEYAEAFYPTVGEALTSLVRTGRPPPARGAFADAGPIPSEAARASRTARGRLADRLNRELAPVHRARLAELGPRASGLYAHYQPRVEASDLIGAREKAVFGLVDAYLPAYDAYGVMRAGLGELALLLAASGRRVIAYEPNRNRAAAIEAGQLHLEGAGLLAPGALRVVADLTPETSFGQRVLGLGLDVAQVADDAAAAPHMLRIAAFEALLIDPRIFLRRRDDPADQAALAQALEAMGFDARRDYPAIGVGWFHRSEQLLERHRMRRAHG
jgi:hypothetical protein